MIQDDKHTLALLCFKPEELPAGCHITPFINDSYIIKLYIKLLVWKLTKLKGLYTVIVTLFSPKEMIKVAAGEGVDEWLTIVDVKLMQELSEKEKEIIFFLLKNKRISSSDCQKLLDISREMANRYFTRLIQKKLITKKGAGKYTFYVLTKRKYKLQSGLQNKNKVGGDRK